MTQRVKSLTTLIRVAGNDLATKFLQRATAELRGATHLIVSYMLYHLLLHPHWDVGLNVNQYINMAKTSSWILRLTGTAWLMLLCVIACAFQNGFDIFKSFIEMVPGLFWALNATWHMSMYKTQPTVGKEGGRATSTLLEGRPNWFGLPSIHSSLVHMEVSIPLLEHLLWFKSSLFKRQQEQ